VERFEEGQGTAVLFSGGLDSAVLLAWEQQERAAAESLLRAEAFAPVLPCVTLHADMHDIYPATHWAMQGTAPGYDTADEDVYIEGRNIVLLAKASVFMARAALSRVLIGPLAGNPFPDATPAFFEALAGAISIEAPLARMHKADVIRLGAELGVPLELSLSCMQPVGGLHCGRCSKCRERIEGFRNAGVPDLTRYAAGQERL
jgi:7-cyano-7-deazaguanine synthase